MNGPAHASLGESQLKELPKILLHEHLDCSLRPLTMLELWSKRKSKTASGKTSLPPTFPETVITAWEAGDREQAAAAYQCFLCERAGSSLANYVQAISDHVLPLMQTGEDLFRIASERFQDAVEDGIAAMHLRFAPQLHIRQGLTLSQVMEAVVEATAQCPLPVKLMICALRHENRGMAAELADLAIRFSNHVALYDLAGDERANPGVPDWWAEEALRVREHGLDLDIHLWETNEPTDEDIDRLDRYQIRGLGHGFRGNRQSDRILEVCPSSNVITGQVASIDKHPVDRLYRQGRLVTINTDGTLFTGSTLTNEYLLLRKFFGWGLADFHRVNQTALEASMFSPAQKDALRALLDEAYTPVFPRRS